MATEADFFNGKPQAARRKAVCKIVVAGVDVTSNIDPHLISIEVVDKRGSIDTCALELDDRDGRLQIPEDQAPVNVYLGWSNPEFFGEVFVGYVTSVESGFGRKTGGRRLWIEATGTASRDKGHTPFQMTWGEGAPPGEKEGTKIKLSQVLQDAAKAAGHSVNISSELGNLERDFWGQYTESFYHLANRLASEVGAVFKVSGNTASFSGLTSLQNAAGQTMGTIVAEWGNNLLEWRIKPYAGRPIWGNAQSEGYDHQLAQWEQFLHSIPGSGAFGGASGTTQLPAAAPNKSVGEQTNRGAESASVSMRGTGWVIINGEPEAHAGCLLQIIGAREGVDNSYCIDEAHHRYSRSSGYTTLCKLTWPGAASGGEPGM